MTITLIVTVIAMLLSAVVALIVAYLHRKQMRQIELYKLDPSAGLIPPPSSLTKFVKSKWDTIFGLGGPILMLASEFAKTTPVTRFTILIISVALVLLFTNIVLAMLYKLQLRTSERFAQIIALQDRQLGLVEKLVDCVFP